ncbi:MAG: hypothetical protein NZ741_11605 [Armatimonadetes bacterium]|nr:hypothetical protein [Armatimonadota bacterium]
MSTGFQRLRSELSDQLRDDALRYQQARDTWEREELAERYLQHVEPLLKYIVWWQAQAFHTLGATSDDLLQWARLAAIEAMQRYDPTRGRNYSAYLVTYVKRYVYNRVLDELPVPRGISKRLRKMTREGVTPEQLPEPLRAAFHLRSPISVDCTLIDALHATSDEHNPLIREAMELLGEELWNDLLDAVRGGSHEWEHLFVRVYHLESQCKPECREYLANLKRYLVHQMRLAAGIG